MSRIYYVITRRQRFSKERAWVHSDVYLSHPKSDDLERVNGNAEEVPVDKSWDVLNRQHRTWCLAFAGIASP